jgi:hypothetical protein
LARHARDADEVVGTREVDLLNDVIKGLHLVIPGGEAIENGKRQRREKRAPEFLGKPPGVQLRGCHEEYSHSPSVPHFSGKVNADTDGHMNGGTKILFRGEWTRTDMGSVKLPETIILCSLSGEQGFGW